MFKTAFYHNNLARSSKKCLTLGLEGSNKGNSPKAWAANKLIKDG